jgi:hypothetical protein
MYIGCRLLVKHDGEIKEGSVIKIYEEYLDIKLDDNTIVSRKFWEVRSIKNEEN